MNLTTNLAFKRVQQMETIFSHFQLKYNFNFTIFHVLGICSRSKKTLRYTPLFLKLICILYDPSQFSTSLPSRAFLSLMSVRHNTWSPAWNSLGHTRQLYSIVVACLIMVLVKAVDIVFFSKKSISSLIAWFLSSSSKGCVVL